MAETQWLNGHAFGDTRNFLVVDVETSGGTTGMGYLFLFHPRIRTITACLEETLSRASSARTRARWSNLAGSVATTVTYGRGGIATMAQSALDIALWDALGKRGQAAAASAVGALSRRTAGLRLGLLPRLRRRRHDRQGVHYKERGYKAIKMQVAHTADLATDLDNVKRMREAMGPDIEIMIDVNMGWTADIAIQMGRKFEDYDVYWLEEPVVPDDFAGYFRIADALDLRIVGGETHFTRFDLKPFFENPQLPILQPDPMRGGLTELRKIATVAEPGA